MVIFFSLVTFSLLSPLHTQKTLSRSKHSNSMIFLCEQGEQSSPIAEQQMLPSHRMRSVSCFFFIFLFCSLICFATLIFFIFILFLALLCRFLGCMLSCWVDVLFISNFDIISSLIFWCSYLPQYVFLHSICPSQTLYITVWLNHWLYRIHDCHFNWLQSIFMHLFHHIPWNILVSCFRAESQTNTGR